MNLWNVSLVLVIIGFVSLPGAAGIILEVQSSLTEVEVGESFSIDIYASMDVDAMDAWDLYAVDLDVSYDTAIMDYVCYTQGDFLRSNGDSTYVIDPKIHEPEGLVEAYVETIVISDEGVRDEGCILTLQFTATDVGSGTISVTGGTLLDGCLLLIDYTSVPGTVRVLSSPEPASVLALIVLGSGLALGLGCKRRQGWCLRSR